MENVKKETLTLEQRIEQLKQQQEQAKELYIKCVGAVEVLEQLKKEDADSK